MTITLAQLETAAKASYDALRDLPPVTRMAAWEDLSIDTRQANLDTMRAGLEAIGIEVER